MEKYLYFDKHIEINTYLVGNNMLIVHDEDNENLNVDKIKQRYYVNDTAIAIVSLIDGSRTYEEIIQVLVDKYNESFDVIHGKVEIFLSTIEANYNVKILRAHEPIRRPIVVNERKKIYPVVASIELTYRCNIKCLHCYGEYGDEDKSEMALDDVKRLLRDLKTVGVEILEFTGGDVSIYPHLLEVLQFARSLDFRHIAVLTNGIALKGDVVDLIVSEPDKFIVQIDLHSLNDDYLKWFTKVGNTLEAIQANIKKFVSHKVLLRAATVVTKRNLHELEDIADWLHDNGVVSSAMGPVVNLGRAQENDVLLDDLESIQKFTDALKKINTKYKNFISIIEDTDPFRENCGSLTSNVTITPNGDVKHCTMDNLCYCNSSIGNVLKDGTIKELYDKNSNYVEAIFSTVPPKLNSDECSACDHRYFCANCILRAFVKRKEIGDECGWYNKHVPRVVKDKLSI